MKHLLCTLVFACLFVSYQAGAQSWVWAENFAILGDDGPSPRMARDAAGNVFVGGVGFVAKYNASGALLWRKDAASGFTARVSDICTDAGGNVMVVGSFWDTIAIGTDTFISASNYDVFVAKYDGGGSAIWAKAAGNKYLNSVATDAAGNVFIAGSFDTSITFDATTLTETLSGSMFLVKFSPGGGVLWAKTASEGSASPGQCVGRAIAVDNGGNVLITGSFTGAITIGTTTLTSIVSGFPLDVYVAKYSGSGSVLWARSAASDHYDVPFEIAVDGAGNSYVTGVFQGPNMVAGAVTLANASSDGHSDIFVLSYDAAGVERWGKRLGGTGFDENLTIAADNAGNVFIAPNYNSATMTFGSTTLYNAGVSDVMIAMYNTMGIEQWAINVGGPSGEVAYALVPDNAGNVYFAGGTASSTLALGATTLYNTGGFYGDIIVAKLSMPTSMPVLNTRPINASVYPNPVSNELVITADLPVTGIRIMNTCGQEVLRKEGDRKEMRVDTRGLAAGVYSVIINGGEVRRFVKE